MKEDDNFWVEFKEILEMCEPMSKSVIKSKMLKMLSKYGKYIVGKINNIN